MSVKFLAHSDMYKLLPTPHLEGDRIFFYFIIILQPALITSLIRILLQMYLLPGCKWKPLWLLLS